MLETESLPNDLIDNYDLVSKTFSVNSGDSFGFTIMVIGVTGEYYSTIVFSIPQTIGVNYETLKSANSITYSTPTESGYDEEAEAPCNPQDL